MLAGTENSRITDSLTANIVEYGRENEQCSRGDVAKCCQMLAHRERNIVQYSAGNEALAIRAIENALSHPVNRPTTFHNCSFGK